MSDSSRPQTPPVAASPSEAPKDRAQAAPSPAWSPSAESSRSSVRRELGMDLEEAARKGYRR